MADDDITNAVSYLRRTAGRDVARRLIDALQSARKHIGEFPAIGSSRFAIETKIPELRDFALHRFPYVVFYTDDEDAVRIHRVLHASQDIPAELVRT
ncbi:type II toxin-antitoxin system RelE/ParE family toxin [Microbacterium sp. C5A9]|nr:type II toxin-antitoxin system RelE/ParE family toxin [Microbacterium sp. C5A9]